MSLADHMREWEELRYETEREQAAMAGRDGKWGWKLRMELLGRRLSAIAAALDLLREPAGPLVGKSVEELIRERNRLLDACAQVVAAVSTNDSQELANGVASAKAAIAAVKGDIQ